jgi:hypothetical protein
MSASHPPSRLAAWRKRLVPDALNAAFRVGDPSYRRGNMQTLTIGGSRWRKLS